MALSAKRRCSRCVSTVSISRAWASGLCIRTHHIAQRSAHAAYQRACCRHCANEKAVRERKRALWRRLARP
jgi:hypothetical protein